MGGLGILEVVRGHSQTAIFQPTGGLKTTNSSPTGGGGGAILETWR